MDTEQTLVEITRSVDALTTARARVASAVQCVEEVALRALRAVRDAEDGTLRDIVAVLYWGAPDLPVRTMASIVGSDDEVRALAGPGPDLRPCRTCGEPRRARTRTELKTPASECEDCREERRRRELEAQRRAEEEWAERQDLEEWQQHLRRWHADEAEDDAERQRLLDVWDQLPRWSCGCTDPAYASWRHRW